MNWSIQINIVLSINNSPGWFADTGQPDTFSYCAGKILKSCYIHKRGCITSNLSIPPGKMLCRGLVNILIHHVCCLKETVLFPAAASNLFYTLKSIWPWDKHFTIAFSLLYEIQWLCITQYLSRHNNLPSGQGLLYSSGPIAVVLTDGSFIL